MSYSVAHSSLRPWIALAAATGINISMGLNYSWSIIQKALISDWHWSSLQASLPYTLYGIVITLAMLFSSSLHQRLGAKKCVFLGASLMGIGLTLSSLSHHPLLTIITYSIAGSGGGICYSTTLPTVIRWFPPEKKGLVSGIVISGSGLAPVYVSLIANWLLSHYGIPQTFLYLGLSISTLLFIMAQFFDAPPKNYQISGTAPNKLTNSSPNIPWKKLIVIPTFIKLWLMYLFVSSAGLMVIGHITTIAQTQAHWENGFYLVILIAIFNTLGRLAAGFFADKCKILFLMKGVFLLLAVDLLSFSTYTTPLLLSCGAAVLGFCYGTCPALFPLATANFFGTTNLSSNYGVLFTAWGCAALIGPILAGKVVDSTGTYFMAYIVSAILLLAAFVVSLSFNSNEEPVMGYEDNAA